MSFKTCSVLLLLVLLLLAGLGHLPADKARLVMPEVPSLRSLVMTDAAGRRFNCSIPSSPPSASTALSPGQVGATY
jgi:hypothetical protein